MARRLYFGVIEAGANGFGIYFPDFPGCVSAGDTLEELAQMATEALQFHVDGMIEDGDDLPDPSAPDLDAERAELPEADLRGLLGVDVAIGAEDGPIELRPDLVRRIADLAVETSRTIDSRRFVEDAVEHEIERYRKSAA